jgi:hypothetical protein
MILLKHLLANLVQRSFIIELIKKLSKLVIARSSYGILFDISRILLLLTEMVGNIMNTRKFMKSMLMNIEK